MLNPIEKFKVAILHLNRDWNHCGAVLCVGKYFPFIQQLYPARIQVILIRINIRVIPWYIARGYL